MYSIFSKFDKDKNASISWEEFLATMYEWMVTTKSIRLKRSNSEELQHPYVMG